MSRKANLFLHCTPAAAALPAMSGAGDLQIHVVATLPHAGPALWGFAASRGTKLGVAGKPPDYHELVGRGEQEMSSIMASVRKGVTAECQEVEAAFSGGCDRR